MEREISINNIQTSSSLGELFGSLAKAQAEFEIAIADSEGYHVDTKTGKKSKYADYLEVIRATRPALTKHGLAVSQDIIDINGVDYIVTWLGHSSGQFKCSTFKLKFQKSDMYGIAGSVTYWKRYTYSSIVGVVTGDEDDDAASAQEKITPSPRQTYTLPISLITPEQYETLKEALGDTDRLESSILENLKIDSLEDMPKERYSAALNWINKKKLELAQAGK